MLAGMLNRHGNQIARCIEVDVNIFVYLLGLLSLSSPPTADCRNPFLIRSNFLPICVIQVLLRKKRRNPFLIRSNFLLRGHLSLPRDGRRNPFLIRSNFLLGGSYSKVSTKRSQSLFNQV